MQRNMDRRADHQERNDPSLIYVYRASELKSLTRPLDQSRRDLSPLRALSELNINTFVQHLP